MNVLILSPGYPAEMPHFTHALAEAGVHVYGLGDQPQTALPAMARKALTGYLHVPSLWDEQAVVSAVTKWKGMATIHRVECLWEPGMILAARIREALDIAGLNVDGTIPFRDKEQMKRVLDNVGIRTPRHFLAHTVAACWEAASAIGFPLIVKPVDGAGSADTYRVNHADELREVLPKLRHVPQVSVEEFVEGDEYTFDAISANGRVVFFSIAHYRPRPLQARSNEWISPQVIALRDLQRPELQDGIAMGHAVLKALKFQSGFTHMEWYRTADGEVVFGEIGARPPGAHQVDQMNFLCDINIFRTWANAVCFGKAPPTMSPEYNVATIYKRARGQGRIHHIEGLDKLRQHYARHIVWDALLPIGAPRRNWRHTLVSDGFLMIRHPDLAKTLAIADEIGTNLHLFAQ